MKTVSATGDMFRAPDAEGGSGGGQLDSLALVALPGMGARGGREAEGGSGGGQLDSLALVALRGMRARGEREAGNLRFQISDIRGYCFPHVRACLDMVSRMA
jgi:hypothetical protein